MRTVMENLNLKQWDEEFNPPCSTHGCQTKAEWMGWTRHGGRRCPHTGFTCTPCKAMVTKWWEEALKAKMGGNCMVCGETVQGQLGDNMRWLPL